MKNNPLKPSTTLKVGKETYELLFTLEAVATAEELTDKSLLTGLTQKDITTPKLKLVYAMLYACLLDKQPQITYEQAKGLVTQKNWTAVWSTILNAWTAGLSEKDEDDEGEQDPK
jgi:hypothetical protein